MNCPRCNAPLPDAAAVCPSCGADVETRAARYTAPRGFTFDGASGLYYRIETDSASGKAVGATWFNTITGKYKQSKYDTEQPGVPPMRAAQSSQSPVISAQSDAEFAQTPAQVPARSERPSISAAEYIAVSEMSVPSAQQFPVLSEPLAVSLRMPSDAVVPPGFTRDPQSGLYYRYTASVNPRTGVNEQWVTWFNPAGGNYRQECLTPAVSSAAPQGGRKKKKTGLVICAVILLLLLGVVGGHFAGFYTLPLLPESLADGGIPAGTYKWGNYSPGFEFSIKFSGDTAEFYGNGDEFKADYTLDWPEDSEMGKITFIPKSEPSNGNGFTLDGENIIFNGVAPMPLTAEIERYDWGGGDTGLIIGPIVFDAP